MNNIFTSIQFRHPHNWNIIKQWCKKNPNKTAAVIFENGSAFEILYEPKFEEPKKRKKELSAISQTSQRRPSSNWK
jgi:hypothetical protein